MPDLSTVKNGPEASFMGGKHFEPSVAGFLQRGGEMGERIRGIDWSSSPVGPIESWSPALRAMLSILLANRFPMLLWWGPHYISFYNDAYSPILGIKHPAKALGLPVRECWSEIWPVLKPLIDTPFQGGPATWMEDIQLEIDRYGFLEETHFTIAYSPVPDESLPAGIGGVLATVHEITDKTIAERRLVALRDLGAAVIGAKSAEEVCRNAAKALAAHDKDVPFALLYLIDAERKRARLAGAAGAAEGGPASPLVIELGQHAHHQQTWPVAEAISKQTMQTVEDLAERFGDRVPPGPWADSPHQAVVVPIRSNIAHQLAGLLVVGVSSRLRLDDYYRNFIELMTIQISSAIASAGGYEQDRRRAEARDEQYLETQNARRAALNVMEDAVQSRQLAEALNLEVRESEERYRTLFNSIDEGFGVIEMIFDQHQQPVDYRFLEVNPTFERQTGIHQATGKRIRELVPDVEAHWFEIYGKVALTGEAVRFVNEAKPLGGRWFDVYACRVGAPENRKVAIIFSDITERKQFELNLTRPWPSRTPPIAPSPISCPA